MRRTMIAILTTSAITLTAACAAALGEPSNVVADATAGTYEIDPSHTSVNFGIKHMGFSTYQGRFNTTAGSLVFDNKSPENSKLSVTIDAGSIDTNNAKLEEELKGDQWFNTAQFPTATFTSTKIEKLTDTTGTVTGDFTLHGVTKPITLTVTFNGGGKNPLANVDELGFSAKGLIKRSDFGISQYIPMVGDDVAISIETEMHLKP